jgi:hypothetical protein
MSPKKAEALHSKAEKMDRMRTRKNLITRKAQSSMEIDGFEPDPVKVEVFFSNPPNINA